MGRYLLNVEGIAEARAREEPKRSERNQGSSLRGV